MTRVLVLIAMLAATTAYAEDDLGDDDAPEAPVAQTSSGASAFTRIDGNHFKGFAAGLGLAFAATDELELDIAGMRSSVWGAYAGVRYRFLRGTWRPYAAAGLPAFFFTDDANTTHIVVGGRIAAGIELVINEHVSALADLGIEYFFNTGDGLYMGNVFDTTAFVPTLAVIGRL